MKLTHLILATALLAGPAVAPGADPTAAPIKADFSTVVGSAAPAEWVAALQAAAPVAVRDTVRMIHFVDCASVRCEESLRAMNSFVYTPLAERGLVVVGVAAGSTAKDAQELAARLGLGFPLVADPKRELFAAIASQGVPRTILLDKEGKVVYQHAGFAAGREAAFRYAAEAVIDGEPVPAALVGGAKAGGPAAPGMPEGFNEQLYAIDIRGQQKPDVPVEKWITEPPPSAEGKYVLVDFWATWCGPCRVALEQAEKIHSKFDGRLVTMAISDEAAAPVEAYVKAKGLKQPIGLDTQGRAKTKLGVRGIPHAFVANPAGKVVWQGHPMSLWSNDGALMEAILGGKEVLK